MACLCLAVFFLTHMAVGLVVVQVSPYLVRILARHRAAVAARATLALRALPFSLAFVLVVVFCVPSYLRFEPPSAQESIGPACIAAAALGLSVLLLSLIHGLRVSLQSARLVRDCNRAGRASRGPSSVLVVDDPSRLVALLGIRRPQIVVSAGALKRLSISQIAVAIRHERAHQESRDNAKRLLLSLLPGLLPGWNGFEHLDASWRRFAEWAADDRACNGRPARALALADALVRMARLTQSSRMAALATPLLAEDQELPTRVERLLANLPAAAPWTPFMRLTAAGVATAVIGAVILFGLDGQHVVHVLLETLVD